MRLRTLLLLALFAMIACDADTNTTPVPVPDTVAAPDTVTAPDTAPDLPPVRRAQCGQPPYEWLPAERVGEVVSFAPARVLDKRMPAALLKSIIEGMGYRGIEPQYDSLNFELRYTSQDRGQPVEATTMVGLPLDLPADEPLPIALWLHGTTGMVDACAPSADAMVGPAFTGLMASLGYFAIAPDYLGLLGFGTPSPEGSIHPYLVGEPVALSTLDAVRAALAAVAEARPDLPPGDPQRIVIIGGSQGGHAAFFTERLAPHYAPELEIIAVAAAVPPTNFLSLARWGGLHWGPASRALPTVFEAMRDWYEGPPNSEVLADVEPFNVSTIIRDWMSEGCHFELRLRGLDDLSQVYQPDYLAAVEEERWEDLAPWSCYLRENSVAEHSLPRVSDTPYLVSYAENDDLVVTEDQRADFARLCALGYRLEYLECGGLGHTNGGIAAVPHLLRWLQARVDGEPLDDSALCEVQPAIDCEAIETPRSP